MTSAGCRFDCDRYSARAQWARHAFRTYGKGRHPARLDFGDCIAYALAKSLGIPLLYVADDFSKTDIVAAIN